LAKAASNAPHTVHVQDSIAVAVTKICTQSQNLSRSHEIHTAVYRQLWTEKGQIVQLEYHYFFANTNAQITMQHTYAEGKDSYGSFHLWINAWVYR